MERICETLVLRNMEKVAEMIVACHPGCARGTGFVSPDDLPHSDEEDEVPFLHCDRPEHRDDNPICTQSLHISGLAISSQVSLSISSVISVMVQSV